MSPPKPPDLSTGTSSQPQLSAQTAAAGPPKGQTGPQVLAGAPLQELLELKRLIKGLSTRVALAQRLVAVEGVSTNNPPAASCQDVS
jgi:hypothetical protein